jgi:hypothetical protein
MKVFALGLFAKPLTDVQRKRILPKEVPDTLRLYRDGKIELALEKGYGEDRTGALALPGNQGSSGERRQS